MADIDERKFQKWYTGIAQRVGLNLNPDDPRHFYDYRALFEALQKGDIKQAVDTQTQHFPSEFKRPGHPTLIREIDDELRNTKTGKSATLRELENNTKERERVLKRLPMHKGAGEFSKDPVSQWIQLTVEGISTRRRLLGDHTLQFSKEDARKVLTDLKEINKIIPQTFSEREFLHRIIPALERSIETGTEDEYQAMASEGAEKVKRIQTILHNESAFGAIEKGITAVEQVVGDVGAEGEYIGREVLRAIKSFPAFVSNPVEETQEMRDAIRTGIEKLRKGTP